MKYKFQKRKRNKDLIGYALIGIVILLIIPVLMFQYTQPKNSLNPDTLCPEDAIQSVTVILFDYSDTMNPVQKASLMQHLKDVRSEIPKSGLLTIYSVGNTEDDVRTPIFSMCNPGRGVGMNPLYSNPNLVEKRWNESFLMPLENVIQQVIESGEQQQSPIMESVQSIVATSFTGEERQQIPRKLIIVSDMLQHTDGYSQYRMGMDFSKFKNSIYFRGVAANLNDVTVEIFYIRRENALHLQGKEHVLFWQKYFDEQNAVLARVVVLEG